jgi:transcriptional regulator with XRE-family HTH domain
MQDIMVKRIPHIKPINIIAKTSKKIIGKMIKIKREERKITQSQLAHLLNIDRQYIWRLENGIINLTMDYLDKIIMALGCTQKDFFAI